MTRLARSPSKNSIANSVLSSALPRSSSTSTPSGESTEGIAKAIAASIGPETAVVHAGGHRNSGASAGTICWAKATTVVGQRTAVRDDNDSDHASVLAAATSMQGGAGRARIGDSGAALPEIGRPPLRATIGTVASRPAAAVSGRRLPGMVGFILEGVPAGTAHPASSCRPDSPCHDPDTLDAGS
jgi:hypothetical protein